MATIELGPGAHYGDIAASRAQGRRLLLPQVRWGALLAGVAVGVSIQLALSLLGVASGLSAIDVVRGEGFSGTAPLVWAAVSMLISAFVGGYVAARLSGLKRKVDGALHGVVSWAVTTLLFATLATSVSGSLLSGIFGNIVPAAAQTAASSGSNIEGALNSLLRNQGGAGLDAATLRRFEDDIRAGQREDAITLLQDSSGMERGRAAGVVDQALIVSGNPERAAPASRLAANQALATASTTAWTVFAAVALSLLLGIAGGVAGALGARRTTWSGESSAPVGSAANLP